MSQSVRHNSPNPRNKGEKVTSCPCLYGRNINGVGIPTCGWRIIDVQGERKCSCFKQYI